MEPGSLPPSSAPSSASGLAPVRWGIGDFFIVYVAGLFGGLVGAAVGAALSGQVAGESTTAGTVGGSFAGTYATYAIVLVFISQRKGRGSLALDFGVRVRPKYWWALFAGAGLQIALGAFVYPLIWLANDEKQSIVEEFRDASGAKRAAILIAAGILAPIFEEILFRGLLLRGLRRRLTPERAIAIQALLFAVAHLADPSLGTVAILPALFALGVISGIAAVRVGDLSVSIPLHMGFNLLTLAALAL